MGQNALVALGLMVGVFVAVWVGSTLLLSGCPWFARPLRSRRSLGELAPFVSHSDPDGVDAVQRWLDRRWGDG